MEQLKVIRGDIFKKKEWDKVRKRFTYIARKVGKLEYLDDIVNSYALHLLEGKGQHQTLDQFFLDYSLSQKWYFRRNSPAQTEKKFLNFPRALEKADYAISDSSVDIEKDLIKKELINKVLKQAKSILKDNEYTAITCYLEDFNHKEIAHFLNCTKSNISILIKSAINKLSDYFNNSINFNIEKRENIDLILNTLNLNSEDKKWIIAIY